MKKQFSFAVLVFSILAVCNAKAQSPVTSLEHKDANNIANSVDVKALVIVYDVSYPQNKPTIEAVNINKIITMIYNTKIITTVYTESGDISTVMSTDANENCFGLLEDQKLMIKSCRNDNLNVKGAKISKTITFTNTIKNILGYECKENELCNEVQVGNFTTKSCTYVYTYDKFKDYGLNYTNIKGTTGLMLGAYTDLTGGVIQITTAKSIFEQFVDSTNFNFPINFSVLTMDEYTHKLVTDANFRKKINEKFKIKEYEVPVVANKSSWKIFLKTLLDNAPEILNNVSNTVKTISDIKNGSMINTTQQITVPTDNNSSINCDSKIQLYERQRVLARNEILRLVKMRANDDAYSKLGEGYGEGTPNPTMNVMSVKSIQSFQNLMRTIREEATKNGCPINKADEEDWKP
jgi:hypothetical protein